MLFYNDIIGVGLGASVLLPSLQNPCEKELSRALLLLSPNSNLTTGVYKNEK